MDSFACWFDRPFKPRRLGDRRPLGTRVVILRYGGSFTRSAAKAAIVLALLALMRG